MGQDRLTHLYLYWFHLFSVFVIVSNLRKAPILDILFLLIPLCSERPSQTIHTETYQRELKPVPSVQSNIGSLLDTR